MRRWLRTQLTLDLWTNSLLKAFFVYVRPPSLFSSLPLFPTSASSTLFPSHLSLTLTLPSSPLIYCATRRIEKIGLKITGTPRSQSTAAHFSRLVTPLTVYPFTGPLEVGVKRKPARLWPLKGDGEARDFVSGLVKDGMKRTMAHCPIFWCRIRQLLFKAFGDLFLHLTTFN